MKVGVVGNWRKAQPNKKLKALALLAGTLTHGLRHFVPNFSPCVITNQDSHPKGGVIQFS